MEKSAFQFSTPVITGMFFNINKEYDAKSHIQEELPTRVDVQERRSENGNSAIVALDLKVGEIQSDFPFCIRAVMQAKFIWEDIEEDVVNNLLRKNAPALLLSYLRPYIAAITSASPFPALQLPFMDFTKNDDDGN